MTTFAEARNSADSTRATWARRPKPERSARLQEPCKPETRARAIVFRAFALLHELELVEGRGRHAATTIVDGCRPAWEYRCAGFEGTVLEIQDRMLHGGYLRCGRCGACLAVSSERPCHHPRLASERTLQCAFLGLHRACPELFVRVNRREYAVPLEELKAFDSPRLARLELWVREMERRRVARDACGRRMTDEDERATQIDDRDPASRQQPPEPQVAPGLRGDVRASAFPRSLPPNTREQPMSLHERIAAAERELRRLGPSVQGRGGDRTLFVAACIAGDYGLPGSAALPLLRDYNATAQPKWTDRELLKKFASAQRNHKRPWGHKAHGAAELPESAQPLAQPEPTVSIASVWGAAVGVAAGRAESVATWIGWRGLSATILQDRDLARVLDPDAHAPSWARAAGRSWADGYQLLLPVWNAAGELAGLRARWLGEPGPAKEVVPRGARTIGTVLANEAGQALLRGDPGPARDGVWVVEGSPDFLTIASRVDHPVFGVFAGAWTAELAARIPDGTMVVVATHPGHEGDAYARQVAATLVRRCEVGRLQFPPGCKDLNDAALQGALGDVSVEPVERVDLRIVVPLPAIGQGRCGWERRALALLYQLAIRPHGRPRDLARTMLVTVGVEADAAVVKALARALVRLAERRELPRGVELVLGEDPADDLEQGRTAPVAEAFAAQPTDVVASSRAVPADHSRGRPTTGEAAAAELTRAIDAMGNASPALRELQKKLSVPKDRGKRDGTPGGTEPFGEE